MRFAVTIATGGAHPVGCRAIAPSPITAVFCGSIILTSNKTYSEWGDIFSDQVLAAAILERLCHHSVTISIRSESYCLRDKRKAGVLQTEEERPESQTTWGIEN